MHQIHRKLNCNLSILYDDDDELYARRQLNNL